LVLGQVRLKESWVDRVEQEIRGSESAKLQHVRQFVGYHVITELPIEAPANDRYVPEGESIHFFSGEQAGRLGIGLHQKNRIQIDFEVPVVPEREVDVVNPDRRAGQGQSG